MSLLKSTDVNAALEALDWKALLALLEAAPRTTATIEELAGLIQRSSSLVLEYPHATREKKRTALFANLAAYTSKQFDQAALALLQGAITLIHVAERPYRAILKQLDASDIAQHPPSLRVSASLSRAAHEYVLLRAKFLEQIKQQEELAAPYNIVEGEDGRKHSVDGLIGALVETTTMMLLMESYKNKWFTDSNQVVLPELPAVNEKHRYQAGSTDVLAHLWRRWRLIEQSARYLGGELLELSEPSVLPKEMPPEASVFVGYSPPEDAFYDWAANTRLDDLLTQQMMEMRHHASIGNGVGIEAPAEVFPASFISFEEVHSAHTLDEILNYPIATDVERPGGLRLVEWLRGYAALMELAEQSASAESPESYLPRFAMDGLRSTLDRLGLHGASAQRFIDAACLHRSSRDLYDSPLIKMDSGELLLFSPALINANPARIVLSVLSSLEVPLSRKGKAFESEVVALFKKNGVDATSCKVKRDGQEYEFDALVKWDRYIFVFECKNHGLSAHNPVQAYYSELALGGYVKQVTRLAGALKKYPDIVKAAFGVEVATLEIVPCVLYSLPYCRPGAIDGVHVADASGLQRFFKEKSVHVARLFEIDKNRKLLHRVPMYSQWKGDKPTGEDLRRQLDAPYQLRVLAWHTELDGSGFVLDKHLYWSEHFIRNEVTVESMSEMLGIPEGTVRKEMARIAEEVRKVQEHVKPAEPPGMKVSG